MSKTAFLLFIAGICFSTHADPWWVHAAKLISYEHSFPATLQFEEADGTLVTRSGILLQHHFNYEGITLLTASAVALIAPASFGEVSAVMGATLAAGRPVVYFQNPVYFEDDLGTTELQVSHRWILKGILKGKNLSVEDEAGFAPLAARPVLVTGKVTPQKELERVMIQASTETGAVYVPLESATRDGYCDKALRWLLR